MTSRAPGASGSTPPSQNRPRPQRSIAASALGAALAVIRLRQALEELEEALGLGGLDRILLSSKYTPEKNGGCNAEGYSGSFDTKKTRPVPLTFEYSETPLAERVAQALTDGHAPIYLVHFTQREAAEAAVAYVKKRMAHDAAPAAANGAALMFEAKAVRLLAPIPRPPSLRQPITASPR